MTRILLSTLIWVSIVLCISGCKPNRADIPPPKPQVFYDFPYKTVVPIERFKREICPNAGEVVDDWVKKKIKEFSPVTLKEQKAIGVKFHKVELPFPLVSGSPQKRVRDIVAKMTPFLENKKLEHEAYVVKTPMINAFTIPGGNIYLTTGLLEMIGDDDDQLAYVIGHELGHNENGHTRENARYVKLAESTFLGGILSKGYELSSMWFGKADELESDLAGIYLAYQAGYDPEKALHVVRKFKQWEGYPGDAWERWVAELTKSHPWAKEREECIRHYLDSSRRTARCGTLYEQMDALVTTSTQPLNIRQFPTENAHSIGKAEKGEVVSIVCDCEGKDDQGEVQGTWAFIATDNGAQGWALRLRDGNPPKEYLKLQQRTGNGLPTWAIWLLLAMGIVAGLWLVWRKLR